MRNGSNSEIQTETSQIETPLAEITLEPNDIPKKRISCKKSFFLLRVYD